MTRTVATLVVVVLAVAAVSVHVIRGLVAPGAADPDRSARIQERLDALPMSVGDDRYRGQRRRHDEELVLKSGADSHTAAIYTDVIERPYQFSVYVGGSTDPEVAFHAPEVCLPAAGWELVERTAVPFDAFETPDAGEMQRMHVRLGEREMLVYSWYQSDRLVANALWKSRFFHLGERLGGAGLRPTFLVIAYVPVRRSLRHTDDAARRFLRAFGPHLLDALEGAGAP